MLRIIKRFFFGWMLGKPEEVTWWTEGRLATRQECTDGLNVNLPKLLEAARKEGQSDELKAMVAEAISTQPKAGN